MDFILTFDREKHLYIWLKMGHEDARADEATGPGSQWALSRDALYATAQLSTSQTHEALLPQCRDTCVVPQKLPPPPKQAAHRENNLPLSPGKGRLPNIFFSNSYLSHSELSHVPPAVTNPRGAPTADQTCYSCQEKVCCKRGGYAQK